MLFLGLDIGSSSIKAAVLDGDSGRTLGSTFYPDTELPIASPQAGWAEQDPEQWWHCVKQACARLFAQDNIDSKRIAAIGISYQMHGLVLVDKQQQPLRPAIIWCDSRAVECGRDGQQRLGEDFCYQYMLNLPGNFTAAKLRWVQQHEPEVFARIDKFMLPGDYIAMKLSGTAQTSYSGLSEAALWDFPNARLAQPLLDAWSIDSALIPEQVANIGFQSDVSARAAAELGLEPGTKISYRSGDQPNNALSLNVMQPGEVAATAGTSGVIYAVTDQPLADRQSRVNTFLHLNDRPDARRNGLLLCINGTGRLYSWLRSVLAGCGTTPGYELLNTLAGGVPVGSEGLIIHPYGNGAERVLQNQNLGGHLGQIDFNRHGLGHLVRAVQEGIVFALNQGFEVLKGLGAGNDIIRVGQGNMFLSPVFAEAFVNTTGTAVEVYATDGAEGAARGAALGCGFYSSGKEAFAGLQCNAVIEPQPHLQTQYQQAYGRWAERLVQLQELGRA